MNIQRGHRKPLDSPETGVMGNPKLPDMSAGTPTYNHLFSPIPAFLNEVYIGYHFNMYCKKKLVLDPEEN